MMAIEMFRMATKEDFPFSFWEEAVRNRNLKISIIGLGYVGLPTATAFHDAGFTVTGYDKSTELIESLNNGKSNVLGEIGREVPLGHRWTVTSDPKVALQSCDVAIICVPTPVNEASNPDLSSVREAIGSIVSHRAGDRDTVIILESTVHPGSTRMCFEATLESLGEEGRQIHLAYCPERISPGESGYGVGDVSRVIGADSIEVAKSISQLYKLMTNSEIHVVSSIEVAEASKLVENAQRDIDLAFVNELSILMPKLGLDVEEVLEAASTKWNFHRHTPGMGVGGHCIPIDPHYYIEISRKYGVPASLSPAARKLNDSMPTHNAYEVVKLCQAVPERVMILGFAYKPNISDSRETPIRPFIDSLVSLGVSEIFLWDPLMNASETPENVVLVRNKAEIQPVDCVVVGTAHDEFLDLDWLQLRKVTEAKYLYDSRRCLDPENMTQLGWVYHAIGMPL